MCWRGSDGTCSPHHVRTLWAVKYHLLKWRPQTCIFFKTRPAHFPKVRFQLGSRFSTTRVFMLSLHKSDAIRKLPTHCLPPTLGFWNLVKNQRVHFLLSWVEGCPRSLKSQLLQRYPRVGGPRDLSCVCSSLFVCLLGFRIILRN